MAILLPAEILIEKNKLYPNQTNGVGEVVLPASIDATLSGSETTDGIFAELLEIKLGTSSEYLRIANHYDDISWGGNVYSRFRFEQGDIVEGDDGDSKSVSIRVSALAGTTQTIIEEDASYLIGSTVVYRLVHTAYPNASAAITGYFEIMEGESDDEWITFELGVENFYINAFPRNTFQRNVCRYNSNQSNVCVYANSASCDRSFAVCLSLGQERLYGGQPGIPNGVWDV